MRKISLSDERVESRGFLCECNPFPILVWGKEDTGYVK